ncbi:Protein CBG05793 [Caenorhabditis briggsae]|uniref:Protein CBG05793 n=1 Tax=Caenorhabditis briggsae TaxID=6238 RepID=A8X1M1_CAEBR|nr:Protein CBG05793 [Caenorhabditis briggsae]CAP26531.1 Protein CBG05793 [Caenorhabditis briggsae]
MIFTKLPLHKLLSYINTCSSSISLFFNGFLIYLILTKSPKEFGAYKYLMTVISVFEVLYSFLEMFLVPIHYTVGSTSAVIVYVDDKLFSRFTLRILNSIYWAFFGSSMAIYALQFIYRYLTISMNQLIKTFYSWKILLWLMIPVLNGVMWALMGILLCRPNKEATNVLRPYVLEDFKIDIDNFDYLGGPLFKIEKGTFILNMNTFSTIAVMSVTLSFGVILFCGFKCYFMISELNSITTLSAKSQSMQSQLFYALVFQTLIPAILLHFPVSVMFGFVLASHGLGIYSCIISITISLYPAIDPLPNFFIISPYRKAAFSEYRNFGSLFQCQELSGCFKRNRQLSEVNQVPPNSKNVVAPANTSAV